MCWLTQVGDTVHVVHDADGNRLAEYDYDPSTQTATLLRGYIWLHGVPVGVVEGVVLYFVRTDHIGRPEFATDGTGVKVWEASYLPFGGVHVSTGTPLELRFPGQWFQSETGLHQNCSCLIVPSNVQCHSRGRCSGFATFPHQIKVFE